MKIPRELRSCGSCTDVSAPSIGNIRIRVNKAAMVRKVHGIILMCWCGSVMVPKYLVKCNSGC